MARLTSPPSWARSIALFAGLIGGAPSAAVAGPVESLIGLTQHPTDDQVLVLQYQDGYGGLLFSRDHGATFQIHPSTAFTAYGIRSYAPVMIAGDGKLLVGLTDGLALDDGQGCAIKLDPTLKGWVTDIARHPTDATTTFVLTAGSRSDASRTGIWKRDADGSITPLAGNDIGTSMGTPSYGKALFATKSLRVIARSQSTEGLRFVETGGKNTYPSATSLESVPTFRYSDDLGASWTEHTVAFAEPADDVVLVAVTETEPMKTVIAVRKTGAPDPADLVLFSNDNGATFSRYIEGINSIGQAVVTPDGRLFVADMGTENACVPSGLWAAPQVGAPAERIVEYPVRCLGYDANRSALYLCKGYELGVFYPDDRAYCRLLALNETDGFVSCSGVDDLAANAAVNEQLCGAWCGRQHMASSPFCAATSCGLAARAGDLEFGWVEPPGIDAPSCAGFVPADASSPRGFPGCEDDAGSGDGSDAGGAGAGDAGIGARDSSVVGPDGATGEADGSAEPPPMETDDGCDCSVRAGRTKAPDLAGLGVALWLLGRSWRSRRRRPDA